MGTCLCLNQFFASVLRRLPWRIRAAQPAHVWVNMDGSLAPSRYREMPRLPEIPGASWCQGNRPDHEGILCLGGEVVKGRGSARCPARAGLHRPLLGERESNSKVPAGTSHTLGVGVGSGAGAGILEITLLIKQTRKLRLREGKGPIHRPATRTKLGTRSHVDILSAQTLCCFK